MTDLFGLLSFGSGGWGDDLARGVVVTITLALATLPLGLALGLGVALLKNAKGRIARALGELYTTVFRGLPELLTILIVAFGAPRLIAALTGATVEINSFVAGVVALGLVFGAFSSEVLLAAIRAVPKGQSESAAALGLSRRLAFRLVVFPQLWRVALPGLSNTWLVLLKDTSLVSVIALADLTRQTNLAVNATKQPFFFYLVACLLYLALSGLSTAIARRLEARADRGFAAAGR